ncbi:MAG: hypothetical protein ACP5MU_03615 [Thermoplasmata archaeon]
MVYSILDINSNLAVERGGWRGKLKVFLRDQNTLAGESRDSSAGRAQD